MLLKDLRFLWDLSLLLRNFKILDRSFFIDQRFYICCFLNRWLNIWYLFWRLYLFNLLDLSHLLKQNFFGLWRLVLIFYFRRIPTNRWRSWWVTAAITAFIDLDNWKSVLSFFKINSILNNLFFLFVIFFTIFNNFLELCCYFAQICLINLFLTYGVAY